MSPALTQPTRSKERAALEIGQRALWRIGTHELTEEQMRAAAVKALRDIRAIVPEGK